MVLDVSNPNTPVLYASSAIDITQDVISLYDETSSAGAPATGVTTPPAGTTAPQLHQNQPPGPRPKRRRRSGRRSKQPLPGRLAGVGFDGYPPGSCA